MNNVKEIDFESEEPTVSVVSSKPSEYLPNILGNVEWNINIPTINSAEEGFNFIEQTLYAFLDKSVVLKNWVLGKIWGQQKRFYSSTKEWRKAIRERLRTDYSDSSIDHFVLFARKYDKDDLSQFSKFSDVMAALYPNAKGQEKKSKSSDTQSTCEKSGLTSEETESTCGDLTDMELGHPTPKSTTKSKPLLATGIPSRIQRIAKSIQDINNDIRTNLKIDCPNQLPGMVSDSKVSISEIQHALNELSGSLENLQDGEVA